MVEQRLVAHRAANCACTAYWHSMEFFRIQEMRCDEFDDHQYFHRALSQSKICFLCVQVGTCGGLAEEQNTSGLIKSKHAAKD